MAKDDYLEVEGVVIEQFPGSKFKVRLENGIEIMAHLSGKMRQNYIVTTVGDTVKVEISVYDPTQGRIVWRSK